MGQVTPKGTISLGKLTLTTLSQEERMLTKVTILPVRIVDGCFVGLRRLKVGVTDGDSVNSTPISPMPIGGCSRYGQEAVGGGRGLILLKGLIDGVSTENGSIMLTDIVPITLLIFDTLDGRSRKVTRNLSVELFTICGVGIELSDTVRGTIAVRDVLVLPLELGVVSLLG